jgi:predicted outer membrane protein
MSNATLVLVLALVPGALGGCAHDEQAAIHPAASAQAAKAPPPAQSMSASQTALAIDSLPEPDRDFLRQAMAANLAAIRFGELAANNGSTVEVRSLGREMVDTHTGLTDQLRTSANTEGITLPLARMTQKQQRMYDELSMLSGYAFDDAFKHNVMEMQHDAIIAFQNEAIHGRLSELAMLANQALPLINQRVRTVQNQLQRM